MEKNVSKKSDIDFVVLWVDSNDPKWQKMYTDFTGKRIVKESNRYRDWGTFKYWFRAVDKYAPWVNSIYLLLVARSQTFLILRIPNSSVLITRTILKKSIFQLLIQV